jgi:hypothetical protein
MQMVRRERKFDVAEVKLLRVEMIVRDLDAHSLAAKAKVHVRTLQNLLSGRYHSWPVKAAINRALHRRIFQKPAKVYRPRKPKQETTCKNTT